jgi:hypothetical protein
MHASNAPSICQGSSVVQSGFAWQMHRAPIPEEEPLPGDEPIPEEEEPAPHPDPVIVPIPNLAQAQLVGSKAAGMRPHWFQYSECCIETLMT